MRVEHLIALDHVLVVILLIVLPAYGVLVGQPNMKRQVSTREWRLGTYWSNSVLLWVMAAASVGAWLLGDRSLADLGFAAPRLQQPWVGILVVTFVAWYVSDVAYDSLPARRQRTLQRLARDAPFLPRDRRELGHFVVLAVSAGVCEEIVYRGYVVQYLVHFTGTSGGGLAVALGLPALVFGLAHWYQGPAVVLRIAGLGLVFGVLYVLTRSLWLIILLHILVDLAGGVWGMWLFGSDEPDTTDT